MGSSRIQRQERRCAINCAVTELGSSLFWDSIPRTPWRAVLAPAAPDAVPAADAALAPEAAEAEAAKVGQAGGGAAMAAAWVSVKAEPTKSSLCLARDTSTFMRSKLSTSCPT